MLTFALDREVLKRFVAKERAFNQLIYEDGRNKQETMVSNAEANEIDVNQLGRAMRPFTDERRITMGFLAIGIRIVPYIFGAVEAVEKFVKAVKGQPKEDAAVGMVHAILQTVEAGADRDLLNDAEINRLTRAVMQAVVALQNGIKAKKLDKSGGDFDYLV